MNRYTQLLERALLKQQKNENLTYLLDDLMQISAQINEEQRSASGKPVSLAAASIDFMNRISAKASALSILTGFNDFDKKTNGFAKGELVIFGGRPGMGKTALFVQMALTMARAENNVAYFTLDLNNDLLVLRFLTALTGFSAQQIRSGTLSAEEKLVLEQCLNDLSKSSICIDDNPTHILQLKEKCRQLHSEGKLDVLIVDYIQLLNGTSYRNGGNREMEVSTICRELKNIAREFDVCVIAASQLSRAVENRGGDKRPMLSDLRESGAIEQDADKVVFVYRPEYYKISEDEDGNSLLNTMELILAKNRNGLVCNSALEIKNNFSLFTDHPGFKALEDLIAARKGEWSGDASPF